MKRWLAVLLALVGVAAASAAAAAHEDGKVELYVAGVSVQVVGGAYEIRADLVDRDSGTPAPGFALSLRGTGPGGASFGPVDMIDSGGGSYRFSTRDLREGTWTVVLAASQGLSASPAIESQRTFTLDVPALPVATTAPPPTSAPPTSAVATSAVATTTVVTSTSAPSGVPGTPRVHLELDPVRQAALTSPNYVAVTATVTDAGTGELVERTYALFLNARDATGKADPYTYHMAYPHGLDPAEPIGIYTGVVIVPRGGTWSIVVNVYEVRDAETASIPTTLASAQIVTEIVAPELEGYGRDTTGQPADVAEIIGRIVHTFIGIAWFALAGVLIIAAWPGRKGLTGASGEWIERRIRRLGSALLWLTLAMWVSGITNVIGATAFDPPVSTKQATRLFRVPYARTYITVLYTKIAVYAVLTALTIPLVRRARAMADATEEEARRHPLRHTAMAVAIALGGAVIVVCVAALTAIHVLSERSPASP